MQATGFTYTPAAGFSGTDAFTYKASDGAAHSPAAAVSIVIGATAFTVTDTTIADFSAGSPDAQIYIAQTGDGEAILRPAAGSELSGTALEAGWTSGMWNEGGDVTLAGRADRRRRVARTVSHVSGRSLVELVATFTARRTSTSASVRRSKPCHGPISARLPAAGCSRARTRARRASTRRSRARCWGHRTGSASIGPLRA